MSARDTPAELIDDVLHPRSGVRQFRRRNHGLPIEAGEEMVQFGQHRTHRSPVARLVLDPLGESNERVHVGPVGDLRIHGATIVLKTEGPLNSRNSMPQQHLNAVADFAASQLESWMRTPRRWRSIRTAVALTIVRVATTSGIGIIAGHRS